MANYSKWDNLDDSDDEDAANDTLERARGLSERAAGLLLSIATMPFASKHGEVSVSKAAEAFGMLEDAKKLLFDRHGKPISSVARDMAGGLLLNMAVAAHDLKRPQEVHDAAVAALALEPTIPYDRSQAHMWRGVGHEGLGRLKEAVEDLKVAVKLDSGNAEAGQRLANAERLLGAAEYVEREEKAIKANSLIERAEAALKAEDYTEAKALCSAALPLVPDFVPEKRAALLLRLGVATVHLGDGPRAREHLLQARELLAKRAEQGKMKDDDGKVRATVEEWLERLESAMASMDAEAAGGSAPPPAAEAPA